MNKININILTLLQNNARISDREISRKVHLSSNAVAARIKRLENDGYIQQYTTILDKSKVNRNLECFAGVSLIQNDYQTVSSFLQYVKSIPEVYRFYHVNSMFDFLLHVVAIDVHDYQKFLVEKITKMSCVRNMTSFVVFNEVISSNIIDLNHLFKHSD